MDDVLGKIVRRPPTDSDFMYHQTTGIVDNTLQEVQSTVQYSVFL